MTRALAVLGGALFCGAALTWLLALLAAVGEPPPVLVLSLPEMAVAGSRVPVRVMALDPLRRASMTGELELAVVDDASAPLPPGAETTVATQANLAVPPAMGARAVVVVGPKGAAVPARSSASLEVVEALPARAELRFRPWRSSVVRGDGPPLYPGFGDFPSSKKTWALVVDGPKVERIEVTANPAETRDPYGRLVVLDREDRLLTGPLEVAPGQEFPVTLEPDDLALLDLIVDGWPREVAAARGQVTLTLPADSRPGAPFVVHASDGRSPAARGVFYVGRVGEAVGPGEGRKPGVVDERLVHWFVDLARTSGATDDPLVAALAAGTVPGPLVDEALFALSRRLTPTTLRAGRRGESSAEQQEAFLASRTDRVTRWRVPYRACAALLAVLAVALAVGSLGRPERRDPDAAEAPRLPLVWGSLALGAGLFVLWVLDWVLGISVEGL